MKIRDKEFKRYISHEDIIDKVTALGLLIREDYKHLNPLFLAVLNGSFMFASDLMKAVDMPCEISFIKFFSYSATESTGKVEELIGVRENVKGRHVIIIEDIVDSGHTISHIETLLKQREAASIAVATLLFKPEALVEKVALKYVGFSIPKTFIVGYGLDYDGYGRNYKDLYQLAETNP